MTTEHEAQQAEAAEIIAWLDPEPLALAEQQLAAATEPEQSQEVEIYAYLAKELAREIDNYQAMVRYAKLYFMARRKTTELMLPLISHGGTPTSHTATLADFGITRQQWSQRQREYNVPLEVVNDFFDNFLAQGYGTPSVARLLRINNGINETDEVERHVQQMTSAARWLFTPERMRQLQPKKRAAIGVLLDAFE